MYRSDGKEVVVDNKFLKRNHPLLVYSALLTLPDIIGNNLT